MTATRTRTPNQTSRATGRPGAGVGADSGSPGAGVGADSGSPGAASPPLAATLGLSFAETMAGPFAMGLTDPESAARTGRRTGWRAVMRATVTVPDLERFADDPSHNGILRGELELPGFRSRIPFSDGMFQLFSPAETPGTSLMRYEAGFSQAGQRYYFAGRKEVRNDMFGLDLWPDTTTLYSRLHRGVGVDGPVIGAGVLRLGVGELVRLLASSRPLHAVGPAEALGAYARFGRVFGLGLLETYVSGPCGLRGR